MNYIQGISCIGSPNSVARAREAVDSALLICRWCYDKIEFNTGVGPFESAAEMVKTPTRCYICETECKRTMYLVSRPDTSNL